eukprot:8579909-Pyramimonas_sp.AAC.1
MAQRLTFFWDGHAIVESFAALLDKCEAMEEYAEIKRMLATRLTERIRMFVRIATGAIFDNYRSDSFWSPAWATAICSRDDLVGNAILLCGE